VAEKEERAEATARIIRPGSRRENGCTEGFTGDLRGDLPIREVFSTAEEARGLVKRWAHDGSCARPHISLGNRPPAPDAQLSPLPRTVDCCWCDFRTRIEAGRDREAAHQQSPWTNVHSRSTPTGHMTGG
jgi:hypothetical protein